MNFVGAGRRERNIAQHQGGLVLAVLAFDESCGLAERLGVVLAIERDGDFGRVGKAGKFDFEIEPRSAQNLRPVDRVNRLCRGRRTGD
jgi:hypothetical protein